MAIIDPIGLFGGDRLRRCSNAAQLHWPRLFLASDGFGRLELNYARIVGHAYSTFKPVPSEQELRGWIREYAESFLLFVYEVNGQQWGQWDTRRELLPRYKTAADRRSPMPPEQAITEWKQRYREQNRAFPKCFGNISESFLCGVGVGGGVGEGKNTCASGDARLIDSPLMPSIDNPPFETTEPDALLDMPVVRRKRASELSTEQDAWFVVWWASYWLHKARKAAREAFGKHVRTAARFQQVMNATKAQAPEMLAREASKRPHGASWLNGERWEDEAPRPAKQQEATSPYRRWEPPKPTEGDER